MRHINKPSQAQGPYCLAKKIEQDVPNKPEKAWSNLSREYFCSNQIDLEHP
jgi:hypothetical protein